MKKALPWIIGAVVVLLVILLMAGNHRERTRRLDERITLREKDRIPYGTAAARSLLPALFPHASVITDNRAPASLMEFSDPQGNEAVIYFSSYFTADDYDLSQIRRYAAAGNSVFIVASAFSPAASSFFGFTYTDNFLYFTAEDSLRVKLETPAFPSAQLYVYPGKRLDNFIAALDTAHTQVLGRNVDGWPDFVGFTVGQGKIYVHTAPLAFSNYFILHKNNIDYFQSVMSVLPSDAGRVYWDEYFLNKPSENNEKEPSWFSVLLRYPGLKWGLLLGMFVLILLLLLGSRRRQRKIPPHTRPTNDSLDFVKTLGRLYYDRHDHQNLAKKMSVYFLEHVRTTYKLPTQVLDQNFVQLLHYKSGYPTDKLETILHFIRRLRDNEEVTEWMLADFHQQLELFYKNT